MRHRGRGPAEVLPAHRLRPLRRACAARSRVAAALRRGRAVAHNWRRGRGRFTSRYWRSTDAARAGKASATAGRWLAGGRAGGRVRRGCGARWRGPGWRPAAGWCRRQRCHWRWRSGSVHGASLARPGALPAAATVVLGHRVGPAQRRCLVRGQHVHAPPDEADQQHQAGDARRAPRTWPARAWAPRAQTCGRERLRSGRVARAASPNAAPGNWNCRPARRPAARRSSTQNFAFFRLGFPQIPQAVVM